MANTGDKLKDQLVRYLDDAWQMENQIVQILENHANQSEAYPVIHQRIVQHLEETKVQRKRMEDRLNAYGETPSAVKSAGSTLMGVMTGMVSGLRPDSIGRNLRDEYTTEHMEIAAYTMLITVAKLAGDEETVKAAERTLREEIAMQEFLSQHLPEAAILSLEQEGVSVSAAQKTATMEGPKVSITFLGAEQPSGTTGRQAT